MLIVKDVYDHYKEKNYDFVIVTDCLTEDIDALPVKRFFVKLFKGEKPTVFIRA